MTHPGRTLTTLYTAVALWLAYCTINTWGTVPLWTSLTMAAAAIAPILAALRETGHADELRAVLVQLERAARPVGLPPVITPEERARFDEITAGFNDKDHAA